jgi:hypothetical protein
MALHSLESILPRPSNPQEATANYDWTNVEGELGTQLPIDYKEFINEYGTGKIDDFLVILNPFSQNKFVNLIERGRRELSAWLDLKQRFPQYYTDVLFPSPGGLFPFAGTDNGNSIFWRTNGVPEAWTVTIFDPRGPEHFDYNGGMADFLSAVLTQSIQCDVFPRQFPSRSPRFEPMCIIR